MTSASLRVPIEAGSTVRQPASTIAAATAGESAPVDRPSEAAAAGRPSWAAAARPNPFHGWRPRHPSSGQVDRQAAKRHYDCQQDGRGVAGQRPQVEFGADKDEEGRDEEALGDARELHFQACRLAQACQDQARPEARQ